MTDLLTRPLVTPVRESRPLAHRWAAPPVVADDAQPTLDLGPPLEVLMVPPVEPLTAGTPEVRGWSAALVTAVLEVLAGRRAPAQLDRWLEPGPLAVLSAARPRRRIGLPGPVPFLRSVRVQHPAAGVAEVTAHGRLAGRPVPLALRLEVRQERWLCTALELVTGPPPGLPTHLPTLAMPAGGSISSE